MYQLRDQSFNYGEAGTSPGGHGFGGLITDSPHFTFDMKDIEDLRLQIKTLIGKLSKIWKEHNRATKKNNPCNDSRDCAEITDVVPATVSYESSTTSQPSAAAGESESSTTSQPSAAAGESGYSIVDITCPIEGCDLKVKGITEEHSQQLLTNGIIDFNKKWDCSIHFSNASRAASRLKAAARDHCIKHHRGCKMPKALSHTLPIQVWGKEYGHFDCYDNPKSATKRFNDSKHKNSKMRKALEELELRAWDEKGFVIAMQKLFLENAIVFTQPEKIQSDYAKRARHTKGPRQKAHAPPAKKRKPSQMNDSTSSSDDSASSDLSLSP